MKLIPLVCGMCGGRVNFNRGLTADCESCGTPHAMVGRDGDDLRPISYIPLPLAGKMTIPLKISLSNLLRKEGFLCKEGEFWTNRLFFNDAGEVDYPDTLVSDDDDPLNVAVGMHLSEPLSEVSPVQPKATGFMARWFPQPAPMVEKQMPEAEIIMEIYVDEVLIEGRLIGHAVRIEVQDPDYEEEANEICALVINKFGVAPDCSLVRG